MEARSIVVHARLMAHGRSNGEAGCGNALIGMRKGRDGFTSARVRGG